MTGRAFGPPGGVVLLYHRVADLEFDPQQLAVTPERFTSHLEVIRALAAVLPLDRMIALADGDALPARAVAITFDDGYADNLRAAQPLLALAGMPATVFASTGPIRTRREFWWDELESLAINDGDRGRYDQLCLSLRFVTGTVREGILEHLAESRGQARHTRGSHRALTPNEVAELSACDNITIGSHTESHPSLAALTHEQQRHEITAAARDLQEMTERPITAMAYPFGGEADVPRSTRRIASDARVSIGCTTIPGRVHRHTDPLQVPRFVVRNWTADEFHLRLCEWLAA